MYNHIYTRDVEIERKLSFIEVLSYGTCTLDIDSLKNWKYDDIDFFIFDKDYNSTKTLENFIERYCNE